jgi:hypothetical protein
MFRVVLAPIIRSAYNCIYSIWYLSHPYCYLTLSWKSRNRFECAVGGGPDDGCKYHPKHVEKFPDVNKLCNVASCWIYIGILLAHPVLHISRIRVNHQTIYLPSCVFPFDLSLSFGFPLPTYHLHVTTYLFTQIFSVESTYRSN